MFYTSAWCTEDESKFRQSLPLELLGQSIQRFGLQPGFRIVMLEGIEKLSTEYLDGLRKLSFTIIDYTARFKQIVNDFSEIDKHYSRYERNCFLRWIAFSQILSENASEKENFWHLDSDVILHTSLDNLAQATSGKTFMLQGCPVFVSVADRNWFRIYEKNLRELDQDIIGYSNRANDIKEECRKHDLSLANQSLYRNPIGSDQDLLEFLISSRKIMQDPASVIFNSKYYYIQNALSLSLWHQIQDGVGHHFRETPDGRIDIGHKQVPFIHYQNTFVLFAGVYLTLKSTAIPDWLIRILIGYSIKDEKFKTTIIFKLVARAKGYNRLSRGRNHVIEKLYEGRRHGIASLLNFLSGS